MNSLSECSKPSEHKRLSNSTAAIAGLATGLSVLVGLIAAHSPRMAGCGSQARCTCTGADDCPHRARHAAVSPRDLATAAGLMKFYSWCIEREEGPPRSVRA